MREYLKPAMEMEAFDVEDVITVSYSDDPFDMQGNTAPTDLDIQFN